MLICHVTYLKKKCVVAITIAERVFIGPRFNLFFRRLLLDIQLVCRIYFHKYWIIDPIFMSFENVFDDINLQVDVRNDKCVYVCKPISKHTLFIHSLFYFSFSLVVVLNFDDLFIFNFKSRLLFIVFAAIQLNFDSKQMFSIEWNTLVIQTKNIPIMFCFDVNWKQKKK